MIDWKRTPGTIALMFLHCAEPGQSRSKEFAYQYASPFPVSISLIHLATGSTTFIGLTIYLFIGSRAIKGHSTSVNTSA
jgi:hypothetical protein